MELNKKEEKIKRLDKLGFEVECVVSEKPPIDGMTCVHDGSVEAHETNGMPAEYITEPPANFEDYSSVIRTLKELYTYIIEINETMGLHIHISVDNNDYYKFQTIEYCDYFMKELKNSSGLWNEQLEERSSPDHRYSGKTQSHKTIERQISTRGGGEQRYRNINFCKALHGTIEYRIFPAVDVIKKIHDYFDFTTDVMIDWLNKVENNGKKKYKDKLSVGNRNKEHIEV